MRTFVPGASVVHTHSFGNSVGSSKEGTGTQSEVLLEDDVVKIIAVLLRPQTSSIDEEIAAKKSKNFDVFRCSYNYCVRPELILFISIVIFMRMLFSEGIDFEEGFASCWAWSREQQNIVEFTSSPHLHASGLYSSIYLLQVQSGREYNKQTLSLHLRMMAVMCPLYMYVNFQK